jgi:hypothetical protein
MPDRPIDVPTAFDHLLVAADLDASTDADELQDALTGILASLWAQGALPTDDERIGHWIRYFVYRGRHARERWWQADPSIRRAAAELSSAADRFGGARDVEDPRLPERIGLSQDVTDECVAFLATPMSLEQAEDELGLFPHQDPRWLERDWSPDADVPLLLRDLTRDVEYEISLEEDSTTATIGAIFGILSDPELQVVAEHYGLFGVAESPQSLEQMRRSTGSTDRAIRHQLRVALSKVKGTRGTTHTGSASDWAAPDANDHVPGRPSTSRPPRFDAPHHDDRIESHVEVLWAAGPGEDVHVADLVAMSSSGLSDHEVLDLAKQDGRLFAGRDGRVRLRPEAKSRAPSRWRWTPPRGDSRNQIEVAIGILREEGQPMRFEDLEAAVGSRTSVRLLRNNLSAAAEINRSDRHTFALVEWGHEPYDTVESLMKRHIERDGGESDLEDIIEDLTSRFTIKRSTVRVYSKTDAFVETSPGRIRVRGPDEEIVETPRPVSAIPRCYLVGGRWSLHITVDEKLLRGFSPSIPAGFAQHLRVKRQSSVLLATDHGHVVSIVRKGMNDTMGRLRPIAELLGLESGDVLVVSAPKEGREPLSIAGIASGDRVDATPIERLAVLLGLEGAVDAHSLAQSLDMPETTTPRALARVLQTRGEHELAACVLEVLDDRATLAPEVDDIAEILGF